MRFVKVSASTYLVDNIYNGSTKPEDTSTWLYRWSDTAQIGDIYDSGTDTFSTPPPPPQPANWLASTDFIDRFTPEEAGRITELETTDPTVRAFVRDIYDPRRTSVDLTHPKLLTALAYLETAVPLAPGRIAELTA